MTGYTAVQNKGSIFTNTTGNILGNNTAFTVPYSIITLAAADVSSNAGATFSGNICGSF